MNELKSSNERTLLDETRQLLRAMREDIFERGTLSGRNQHAGENLIHRIDALLASPVETTPNQRDIDRNSAYEADIAKLTPDAERYRFLREPGNAIVYAQARHAWGKNASGHVHYRTAEELDAAVDAARCAEKNRSAGCADCGAPFLSGTQNMIMHRPNCKRGSE